MIRIAGVKQDHAAGPQIGVELGVGLGRGQRLIAGDRPVEQRVKRQLVALQIDTPPGRRAQPRCGRTACRVSPRNPGRRHLGRPARRRSAHAPAPVPMWPLRRSSCVCACAGAVASCARRRLRRGTSAARPSAAASAAVRTRPRQAGHRQRGQHIQRQASSSASAKQPTAQRQLLRRAITFDRQPRRASARPSAHHPGAAHCAPASAARRHRPRVAAPAPRAPPPDPPATPGSVSPLPGVPKPSRPRTGVQVVPSRSSALGCAAEEEHRQTFQHRHEQARQRQAGPFRIGGHVEQHHLALGPASCGSPAACRPPVRRSPVPASSGSGCATTCEVIETSSGTSSP